MMVINVDELLMYRLQSCTLTIKRLTYSILANLQFSHCQKLPPISYPLIQLKKFNNFNNFCSKKNSSNKTLDAACAHIRSAALLIIS